MSSRIAKSSQIAQARRAQARTDAVRRELVQNADKAERRGRLIGYALRDLGGVPDVVTPLTKPGDVRAVIGYEQTHKNRASLLSAAQTQLADIAKKTAGISS